jgi:predicted amidohydrolase
MNRTLRVGLAFDIEVLLLPRYKERVARLDILVFPELIDGGYSALKRGMKPHSLDHGFMTVLRNASREFWNTIVAGSTFLKSGTARPTNTSLVFSRGNLIHRYDKIHLFKPAGDTRFFQRGLNAGTFSLRADAANVKAGVVICYDLRFPELVRTLALEGMQILFVPARWPAVRDEAWQTLLKARAMENQIFVVGCNSLDDEGGFSYAFDPIGKRLFTNRKERRKLLQTIAIDLGEIDDAKKLHRNLAEAVFLRQRLSR